MKEDKNIQINSQKDIQKDKIETDSSSLEQFTQQQNKTKIKKKTIVTNNEKNIQSTGKTEEKAVNSNSENHALSEKINSKKADGEKKPTGSPQRALDDARRVKVLSPGALVAKKFFRNKLAMFGLFVLIFMFLFCFIGVYITPYGESQMFDKYEEMIYDYGSATYRSDYSTYNSSPAIGVNSIVKSRIKSYVENMIASGEDIFDIEPFAGHPENERYRLVDRSEGIVYTLQKSEMINVATLSGTLIEISDNSLDNDEFRELIRQNSDLETAFDYEGRNFTIESSGRLVKIVREHTAFIDALVSTNLVFNAVEAGNTAPEGFMFAFGTALGISETFIFVGETFNIVNDFENNEIIITQGSGQNETELYHMNNFVVRSRAGFDEFSIEFKSAVKQAVSELVAQPGITESQFIFAVLVDVPVYVDILDKDGKVIGKEQLFEDILDEYGEVIDSVPVYTQELQETDIYMIRNNEQFTIRTLQLRHLLDTYASPSTSHWLGTDIYGMDVLTRIMYGGRVSLIIGFVVVILEILIGVIMGGIAGFFGKWVDNLIMRIVDIFNCLPFLPILIILGAVMDKMMVIPVVRIIWMMAVLGFMGWSGIARMVRGQILSLREQEFMIATEATGLKTKRRIFKHLIPNVMPQLIVLATMGLGSIILMESTLSFLGLGAKFPMATWGSMINNVSSAFALQQYVYIWLPVGLMICLTVIAFNFVGDGLRDAFDPKMRR